MGPGTSGVRPRVGAGPRAPSFYRRFTAVGIIKFCAASERQAPEPKINGNGLGRFFHAQTYDALGIGWSVRARALALAALFFLLAPWRGTLKAMRVLRFDPALHSPLFADLARETAALPKGECLGWAEGVVSLPGADDEISVGMRGAMIGDLTFPFYSSRPVRPLMNPWLSEQIEECPVSLVVVPRSDRWKGEPAGKLYRLSRARTEPSVSPARARLVGNLTIDGIR